MGTLSAALIDT